MWTRCLLWFCALTAALAAGAGERGMVFRQLGAERGLLQSSVSSIVQDREGWLWVGTQAGLHRWDGSDMRPILDADNPAAPEESMVTALAVGAPGELWVGTATAGLARLDSLRLRYLPAAPATLPDRPAARQITALSYRDGEGLWVASLAGVERIDEQGRRSAVLERSTLDGPQSITGLAPHPAGGVWIGTEQGVFQADPAGRLSRLGSVRAMPVDALSTASDGSLWIKSAETVYRVDLQGRVQPLATIDARSTATYNRAALLDDGRGGLWHGIAGRGLVRIDTRSGAQRWQHSIRGLPGALPEDSISALLLDRSGLLWVGTEYSGIWYAPIDGSRFRLVVDTAELGEVRGNNVRALQDDGSGRLWVGTDGAGLKRYDPDSGRFERHDASLHEALRRAGRPVPRQLQVFGLRRDAVALWVAASAGAFRLQDAGGVIRAERLPLEEAVPDLEEELFVRTVTPVAGGRIGFGTQAHGFFLMEGEGSSLRVRRYRHDPANPRSIGNGLVLVSEVDRDGRLWVGTLDGLSLYRPDTDDWLVLRHARADPRSLPSSVVRAIHAAEDGSLWIGTHGGMARLDALDVERGIAQFTRYGATEAWPDPTVYAIASDSAGRLWLSGNRGLAVFDRARNSVLGFGPEDGLQAYEFNGNAVARLGNGDLAFGGVRGLNLFNGAAVQPSDFLPPVVLTRWSYSGDPQPWPTPDGALILPAPHRQFGFEFTALDYRSPARNRHAWRLLGVDQNWTEGSGPGRGAYANLAAGRYVLELRGSNSDGVWNPQVLSIPVQVLPAWYATSAARLLSALLVLLAAVAFWVALNRRRRRRRAYLQALREREDRLQLALWGSDDGFWDWEIGSGRIHREGLDRVLGRAESSATLPIEDWKSTEVHPDDLALVAARIERHLRGESEYYESEHRLRDAHGQWTWVLARGRVAERDAAGKPLRIAGTVRNIEAQRRQQHEARIAGEVIHNMSEAVAVLDEDFRFRQVNPAFEAASGYTATELIGQAWDLLASPLHSPGFYRGREKMLRERGRWRGECWQRDRSGNDLLFATDALCARDRDRAAPYHIVVQNDITARKRAEMELRYLANYDPLTGLANRALLMEQVELSLQHAAAQGTRLAMLFMDLDRFKQINDSLGHAVGDELLKAVGERMRSALPASAFIARQGGDEFTVLLDDLTGADQSCELAATLLGAFAEPIRVRGNEVQVTPSIGIAVFPDHGQTPADLLRHADAAMYAAKSAGRNTWRMYAPELAGHGHLRVALEQSARGTGLADFRLHYQPIVRIADRQPVAVEALLRWRHPTLGPISPEHFIPLLEESGLIVPVGRHALRTALLQLAEWRRDGLASIRMAVNLSTLQLLRAELPAELRAALQEAGLPGSALELELTETLLMSNPEQAIRTLGELKSIGVEVAVDDFGTGYSSLGYLKRLPIEKLKIDREFIHDLLDDPDDATIVQTVIAMAKALRLRATAEGVETEAQLDFLARHGCEEAQGFLLCRPLPAAECAAWLRAQVACSVPAAPQQHAGDQPAADHQ